MVTGPVVSSPFCYVNDALVFNDTNIINLVESLLAVLLEQFGMELLGSVTAQYLALFREPV